MEAAEDEFVAAVDDAMGKMKAVVENPEPLKNLADLVAAQLAYYKVSVYFQHCWLPGLELMRVPFQEAYEALAEVSPELDELQVTNEALLRHPTS